MHSAQKNNKVILILLQKGNNIKSVAEKRANFQFFQIFDEKSTALGINKSEFLKFLKK